MNNGHIIYGFHTTPFGNCCIAIVDERVCYLSFIDDNDSAIAELANKWPHARLQEDHEYSKLLVDHIFSRTVAPKSPKFVLHGTEFQQQVWQKLCEIPVGQTRSYEQVAQMLGKPTAVRAVANAIAKNHIAYLIPCHRVIRASGLLGGYRWGISRKKAMLQHEMQG